MVVVVLVVLHQPSFFISNCDVKCFSISFSVILRITISGSPLYDTTSKVILCNNVIL